jgi:hypothetical protein
MTGHAMGAIVPEDAIPPARAEWQRINRDIEEMTKLELKLTIRQLISDPRVPDDAVAEAVAAVIAASS